MIITPGPGPPPGAGGAGAGFGSGMWIPILAVLVGLLTCLPAKLLLSLCCPFAGLTPARPMALQFYATPQKLSLALTSGISTLSMCC